MLGTIVNVVAVLIGGSIGLLLKKGLPKRLEKSLMTALGLCTAYLGISGLSDGKNTLILIALALNMMGISKFKVMNFVPAIFIPMILCTFM